MVREQEIEEMAVILTDGGCTKCNCDENGKFNCLPMYNAELLYSEGYRKQSEVAMEAIDVLCELHDHFKSVGDIREAFAMLFAIAELKKKYTERKEDKNED